VYLAFSRPKTFRAIPRSTLSLLRTLPSLCLSVFALDGFEDPIRGSPPLCKIRDPPPLFYLRWISVIPTSCSTSRIPAFQLLVFPSAWRANSAIVLSFRRLFLNLGSSFFSTRFVLVSGSLGASPLFPSSSGLFFIIESTDKLCFSYPIRPP